MPELSPHQFDPKWISMTASTYKMEHETLEPRTREQWGHDEVRCRTCHPTRQGPIMDNSVTDRHDLNQQQFGRTF